MRIEEQAPYRGRETSAKALGKTWKFSRWTIDVIDDLTHWARPQLPDPLAVAEVAVLRLQRQARDICADEKLGEEERAFRLAANLEQQERVSRLAMDRAVSYLAFNSPEFQSLLNHPRGTAHLFYLLLKPNHPDMTDDLAHEIVKGLEGEDGAEAEAERIMVVTSGRVPKGGAGKRGNLPARAKR